jgi:conjugal transfer mating pair stabilization protein TraN
VNRLARLAVLAAVASAAAFAHAQTGNLYELPDYEYFDEQSPTPTPTPTSNPKPAPSPVPSAASAPLSAAPTASATPTPSESSVALSAVGAMAAARAEAKALATPQRAAAAQLPTTADLSAAIPHYSSAPQSHESYMDDPDALAAGGASAAAGSDPFLTVINPSRPTVTLGPDELARAKAVQDDPNAYTQGQSLGGAAGSCTPLPPSTGGQGFYEATCNVGASVQQEQRSCSIPLEVRIEETAVYKYYAEVGSSTGVYPVIGQFADELAAGNCQNLGATDTCQVIREYGLRPNSRCGSFRTDIVQCSAPIPDATGNPVPATGQMWFARDVTRTATTSRNEGVCSALASNANCQLVAPETCTSSDPVTRIVDGVEVTAPCWAWSRSYQCTTISQASDCQQLDSNASCTFASEICLDDPPSGACQVRERVYHCPLPGNEATGGAEYICSGDLYCIDGECEPIVREASTEFKDALVGLHTLGQANAEFNDVTMTLFSGERETCHKKVFGLSNCCSGKGVPLVTPFLCSAAERQLDEKDDKGLCHKVGTYCSDSVLGVCVTRKDAYCCFASKLTRILQEQGRPQIGMPWGSPKTETCKGFTVEQFSQLDLSVMDFTEVYAEFVDAAKLPDEVQATQQIQQRIVEYYEQRATTP